MKLGILTFHSAHNYGAVLQAYGLQQHLASMGHDVYVIDYRPDYITHCYPRDGRAFWMSSKPTECTTGLVNYFIHKGIRHKRWDNFEGFVRERLRLYPYSKGMDFQDFDAVFIGSDQVWSLAHTGGHFDGLFFGDGFRCKVITYAPSCTSLSLNDGQKAFFSEHLNAMTAVSVREADMKRVLQPLTDKEIAVVVDPSLLAGKRCFDPIAFPIHRERPYILTYEIGDHPEVYNMAKAMARRIDADIVELVNGMRVYHRRSMHEDASPEEFLGYIKHAACVLTTSFHGTAFSLLFHTPFYTVLQHSSADTRMVSLLTAMHMDDRMIDMGTVPPITPLDANLVDHNLSRLVSTSSDFIKEALKR